MAMMMMMMMNKIELDTPFHLRGVVLEFSKFLQLASYEISDPLFTLSTLILI